MEEYEEYSFDVFENTITVIEYTDYPAVFNKLMQYINDSEADNMLKSIIEFCHDYNYSLDAVAEVIKRQKNFKNEFKEHCIDKKILTFL